MCEGLAAAPFLYETAVVVKLWVPGQLFSDAVPAWLGFQILPSKTALQKT